MIKTWRPTFFALTLMIGAFFVLGCASGEKKNQQTSENKADIQTELSTGNMGKPSSVAGITWTIPAHWKQGPSGPMRFATYIIKPADSDQDSAECAVFFFSGGQGGSTQANLDRWIGQMEQPDGKNSAEIAKINKMTSNNMLMTMIDLAGTYKVSGGPMMQVREKKPDYHMLGAIIEGPEGSVFFKLVGPEKTVESAYKDFMTMVHAARPKTI